MINPFGHLHSSIGDMYRYYRPLSVDMGGVDVVVDMSGMVVLTCPSGVSCVGAIYQWNSLTS